MSAGMPGDSSATVRLVDVFAKQIEMSAQLAVLGEQMKQLPDHEARLRVLERFRFTVLGAAALISALGTWVGILLSHR